MLLDFSLPDGKSLALSEQDYSDWHRHRPYFGVWYVPIDENLTKSFEQIRLSLSDMLTKDYRRQFHLTVFVAGFLVSSVAAADELDMMQVVRQAKTIADLSLQPFELPLLGLSSFWGSSYIAVGHDDRLLRIRQSLALTQAEISPAAYCPHITLGFYNQAYDQDLIKQRFAQIDSDLLNLTIPVKELVFGVYQAKDLQGRLYPKYYQSL